MKGYKWDFLSQKKPMGFLEVAGVCGARYRDGKEERSKSVLLESVGELPERIFSDYVSYRGKAYVRTPLRCYCCQEYRQVAIVCRRRIKRCRRWGKDGWQLLGP